MCYPGILPLHIMGSHNQFPSPSFTEMTISLLGHCDLSELFIISLRAKLASFLRWNQPPTESVLLVIQGTRHIHLIISLMGLLAIGSSCYSNMRKNGIISYPQISEHPKWAEVCKILWNGWLESQRNSASDHHGTPQTDKGARLQPDYKQPL